MKLRNFVVAGLVALGAAGAAIAGSDADADKRVEKRVEHRMHGHRGASVEFTAMHNIMAELLSAKTGKTTAEINKLFEQGGPHEVAEELNLEREDMRALMKEARGTLITRAQKAKLITAEQAEKLRAAKVEMRHKRRHHEDDED